MVQRKKVLITGASSGIGRAAAFRFAKENWDVCLLARRKDLLEDVFNQLEPGHHLISTGSYDDPKHVQTTHDLIKRQWGKLDVLVNNAGVFMASDAISSPLEQWRIPFDLMINGAVQMTRLVVPFMSDGGRIIHVTSIHGERAERGSSAYAMAKAALNQYCRALALELAPSDILVNALAPGFITTPMSIVNGIDELDSDWFKTNYKEGHHLPLKRAGQPEEIAGVAFFLAGPDASYLTGQVITVDGGLSITF